jgi:hypothetical protein
MTISVNCTACGKVYSLKTEAVGQTFVCQACGGQVEVPGPWQPEPGKTVSDSPSTSGGNFQPLPGTTTGSTPSGGQQAALERVKLPAIFMMVIAGISIPTNLVVLVLGIVGIVSGANSAGYQWDDFVIGGTLYIISGALGFIGNIVILVGSWKMKSLKAYGFSLVAMILAMIPCNACCMITLPLSIWGLVVLNDANVKAAFKRSR